MREKSSKKLKKSVDKRARLRYINKAVAKNGAANYKNAPEKF